MSRAEHHTGAPHRRGATGAQIDPTPLDAVILAGGAAHRMGGADKPGLCVGGRTLLERAADAVRAHAPDAHVIVVGPERDSPRALYTREDPPGGGPVPALNAGLRHVRAPRFFLLAADLPHLCARHLAALSEAAHTAPGAVFVDDTGHEQWLTGLWHTETVRGALTTCRRRSLRGLLGPLAPHRIHPGEQYAVSDCDTPEDLARARAVLGH